MCRLLVLVLVEIRLEVVDVLLLDLLEGSSIQGTVASAWQYCEDHRPDIYDPVLHHLQVVFEAWTHDRQLRWFPARLRPCCSRLWCCFRTCEANN